MALPLIPLLALFGGAAVIAADGKKKARSSSKIASKVKGCSPKALFGPTGVPYPLAASQFVKDWVAQHPNSGTAAFVARDKRWSTPFLEGAYNITTKLNSALPYADEVKAEKQLEDLLKELRSRMETSFMDSQAAASEILSDIGCGQSRISDLRVSSIVSNDSHWMKILIWAGVLSNLQSSKVFVAPRIQEDISEEGLSLRVSELLIGRLLGFKNMDYPSNKAAGTKLAEKIKPLTHVSRATIAEIRSELRSASPSNEKWLFGPLEEGAKPWTELEASYISSIRDTNMFFQGSEEIPTDDWNVSDFGLDRDYLISPDAFEWWVYGIMGSAFKSKEQATLVGDLFFGIRQGEIDGGFYPKTWHSWATVSGLNPVAGVRTRFDWWRYSGMRAVDALLSMNPELSGDIEGLAIVALTQPVALDPADPGTASDAVTIAKNNSGEPYIKSIIGWNGNPSGNWLLNNFPRLSTKGASWQAGPVFGYWKSVKAFEQKNPLAFYAILNAMMLIGNQLGADVTDYLDETE